MPSSESPLNLRQLKHVMLLAEELHFGRAGAKACLSQSAFSRSIAALEAQVGLRLFDRGPGLVRLTAAGERVVARAQRMLSGSAELSRELARLRTGDLGDVAAGSGPFSGLSLLAESIAQVQSQHPSIRVRLEVAQVLTLQQQLLSDRLDFMVGDINDLLHHDQCAIERLGVGTGGLFVRVNHPLAVSESLTLAMLAGQRFASVHLPQAISRRLGQIFGADESGRMALSLECESVLVLREYALRQDVVVLATDDAFGVEVAAGLMRRLTVPELEAMPGGTPLRMALVMVWQKDRSPSMAMQLLMDSVRERARLRLAE